MIMKFIACLQRIWRAKVSEQQECCEHSYGAISHVPHSVCDTTSAHSEWNSFLQAFRTRHLLLLRSSIVFAQLSRSQEKWCEVTFNFFFCVWTSWEISSEKNRCAEIKTKILTLWAVEAFQLDRVIPAFHRIHPAEHRRSIPDLFRAGKRFLGRSVRQLVGSLVGRWFIHVDVERMHFILSANAHQLANPPTRLFRHQLIADFIR